LKTPFVERRQESRPVVDRFFAWCQVEAVRVLDETPLAKGIRHAHWRQTVHRPEVQHRLELPRSRERFSYATRHATVLRETLEQLDVLVQNLHA
jgi:hypothetical protein